MVSPKKQDRQACSREGLCPFPALSTACMCYGIGMVGGVWAKRDGSQSVGRVSAWVRAAGTAGRERWGRLDLVLSPCLGSTAGSEDGSRKVPATCPPQRSRMP